MTALMMKISGHFSIDNGNEKSKRTEPMAHILSDALW